MEKKDFLVFGLLAASAYEIVRAPTQDVPPHNPVERYMQEYSFTSSLTVVSTSGYSSI